MKKIFRSLMFVFLFAFILISIFGITNINKKSEKNFNVIHNTQLSQGTFENTSGKEVTALGVSPIINPEYGNGGWNKVW